MVHSSAEPHSTPTRSANRRQRNISRRYAKSRRELGRAAHFRPYCLLLVNHSRLFHRPNGNNRRFAIDQIACHWPEIATVA